MLARFQPLTGRLFRNTQKPRFSIAASTLSNDPVKPFDKILIANRGEIACRVIRTAKKLGVKTVAIYSEPDASSMHVRLADESFCVGPAASKDSYLRMDRILEIAKQTGAQAIHPGYGFLSENAKFVDMVEAAGIAFIGPSSAPMNAMGDKINSKKIAKDAGCFVIPGFEGEVQDEDHAARLAAEVGYPVMIKASAGGGGKGMRVAYNDDEVREGFRLSKAEALSSFGDDRMLIERFIEDPHHIEIQVMADTHGNVVAFPERECSVQRRNQKVVEESPSCLLTPATRRAMQEQAILLCKATGYRSAGTVEMLADGKQNFYFLEMNTRLQVEHPITELVSGEDLVEHMLWVAAGKALPERLTSVVHLQPKGWALESRVYAEDPLRNFLPTIGPLNTYREPIVKSGEEDGVTVRIDTGVCEGASISMFYDPMIAKLCTHAPTRSEAIVAMEDALDQYFISGLVNNIPFLRSIYRNKSFRTGNYGTSFIPEQYPNGFHGVELTHAETLKLLASSVVLHQARVDISRNSNEAYEEGEVRDYVVLLPADVAEAGTAAGAKAAKKGVVAKDRAYRVTLSNEGNHAAANITRIDCPGIHQIEKVALSAAEWEVEGPLARLTFVETTGSSEVEEHDLVVQYEGRGSQHLGVHGNAGEVYLLRAFGSQQKVTVRTLHEHNLARHILPHVVKDTSKYLLCPMPGTLISISVHDGQVVEAGQQIAVIEAMKMQNVLRAAKKSVVKHVRSKPGAHLKVDQVIVEFQEEAKHE